MNTKHIRRFTSIIIILISILACDLPGTVAPQPVSSDPNIISTIVAGTANAAAAQTALAATSTPLPSPTEITAPTSTATPTPRVSTEGTSLQKQSDGSYLFTDYQGGYSVVAPSDWLVVRINEQEYINAWALPEASDPKIQNFLTRFQKLDPKVYRLMGADTNPEHLKGSFLTNLSISWDRNSALTLQQEIDHARADIPKTILNAKVTYADVGLTSTKIPMGIAELSWNSKDTSGQPLNIYQKMVFFKVRSGTLVMTLSTTQNLKSAVITTFDLMTDQIKMLP